MIACTSRDEVNLVAGSFARVEAPKATTVIRTSNIEYLELWRQGRLDLDFIVSSELETAHAISRTIGVPAARQTDVFAEGQVQIVEFDVVEEAHGDPIGVPLREAQRIPADSKVASIIRGDTMILPRGDEVIRPGDRVVVIGSPGAARRGASCSRRAGRPFDDVVVFGAGRVGTAIARMLLEQDIAVRLVEPDRDARARGGRGAAAGTRLQRLRHRPRLPRAGEDRACTGGRLRHARRRQEPLRCDARQGARRLVHDRDRERAALAPRSSSAPAST